MRFSTKALAGALSLLLALSMLWGCDSNSGKEAAKPKPAPMPTAISKAAVGAPAPDFTLTLMSGEQVKLSALKGKVVFVNLWATWCPPCREEMPSMVEFYNLYHEKGVELVAISEDTNREEVTKMLAKLGVAFPVGLDNDRELYQLYGATGVPETHLVDKIGVIRGKKIGPFNWMHPEFHKMVDEELAR